MSPSLSLTIRRPGSRPRSIRLTMPLAAAALATTIAVPIGVPCRRAVVAIPVAVALSAVAAKVGGGRRFRVELLVILAPRRGGLLRGGGVEQALGAHALL